MNRQRGPPAGDGDGQGRLPWEGTGEGALSEGQWSLLEEGALPAKASWGLLQGTGTQAEGGGPSSRTSRLIHFNGPAPRTPRDLLFLFPFVTAT